MRGPGTDLLCEREHELAVARAAVGEAAAGAGCVLLVEGPPGIGKTRLLGAVAGIADEARFEVHGARGDELERAFAYGVVRQLLAPWLARLDPSVRAVALEGPAAAVAALVERAGGGGPSAGPDPTAGPGDESLVIAHGLHRLVQDLADRGPHLLYLDDAHWADTPSLEALGYLARRLDGLPVIVASACRSPARGHVGDRLGRFRSVTGTRRLEPGPLSEDAVGRMATAVLQDEVGPGFRRRLRDVTGGNPFLLSELLAVLRAGQPAWEAFEPSDVEGLVPEPVARSVLRRVGAAGDPAVRLAEAVAVLGEATVHDAAALAELGEAEAVEAADRLGAADVIASGPRLRFAHPLVRQAVRSHVLPARLALMHTRAARLLAGRGAPLDQVAGHLLEALPRADPWAVDALLAAADRELRRGSATTAATLLARARDEPPPPDQRQRVVLALARAQTRSGHPEAVATARAALAGTRGPAGQAEATLQLVRTLGLSGDLWSALDLLHERTAGSAVIDPDLALQLEAELLGVARLQADRREEALARLDRLAHRARPPRPATRVLLANLALSALERNEPPDTVAGYARTVLGGGWPVDDMSFQLVYAFEALTWIDHLDEAARACDSAAQAARRTGSLALAGVAHGWRSMVDLRRGAVSDAEAEARIGYDLVVGLGASWRTPYHRAPLADALLVRGQLEEAERVLADAEPEECADDNPFFLDSRGRLRLAQGDADAALRDFLTCGRVLARRGGVGAPAAFPWRSQAALAYLHLGDRGRARPLAGEELALAAKGRVPGAVGEALIVVGMLDDGDAGVRRLRRALVVLDGSPRVLTRIRALTELGAMLRRNREARAARDHLRTALHLAHRHGATALADRAREELVIAGGRPRRAAVTGLDALTPSERRVAQLVAQGLTNRQIAHALFVSPRTVTTHLTHIYQKLGTPSRTEIGTLLEKA